MYYLSKLYFYQFAGNMKSVLKQENLTELVKSTVKRICKVSLDYEDEIEIQGKI